MGIPYEKKYGGAGSDVLSYAIAEELARVDGGAGVILSAHVSLGSYPIMAFGTEEQKQKYLVPLAKGREAGRLWSDRAKCRQRRRWYRDDSRIEGDHYVLNGGKIFITNAPIADTYIVFAVTTPNIGTRGISALL